MAITSHDVARLAGVSQPTVSRALRDDPRVSRATREKVRRAAASLDYVPSEAGRTLSTRATRRVGVIVTDLANPFYPHVVAPLHDELERLGYRMMLVTERSDEAVAGERLLDQSLDGVVLATATTDSRLPALLERRGTPHVFLNRDTGRPGDFASVVDNEGGGRLVARSSSRWATGGSRASSARPTPPRAAPASWASGWRWPTPASACPRTGWPAARSRTRRGTRRCRSCWRRPSRPPPSSAATTWSPSACSTRRWRPG
ncbi:LacI family transcriptional regulator [Streptomyces sp. AD16]|nr:LacI family transcriptional regulator [Streptomyces sp. AD16]